jgi:Fe-S cluster assembly iron-binding protein IscA
MGPNVGGGTSATASRPCDAHGSRSGRHRGVARARRRHPPSIALRGATGHDGIGYSLFFDERLLEGDFVARFGTDTGAVEVVVDRLSAPYVWDSTIDFLDLEDRQGFSICNPNEPLEC